MDCPYGESFPIGRPLDWHRFEALPATLISITSRRNMTDM
jgi:hypothetical protein